MSTAVPRRRLTTTFAVLAAAVLGMGWVLESSSPPVARRWKLDTIVLRCDWGSSPGEVGKIVADLDANPDSSYLLTFGPPTVVVARDGGLCIADTHNRRVQFFDAHGRLRWCVGRAGLRPGEFSGGLIRAVVGPTGDVYVKQSRALPREPDDPAARAKLDQEAWRSGVMCLTPKGAFRFSTHADPAFAKALGVPPEDLKPVRDFWVDDRGRIYESYWQGRSVIACFRPDGTFDRLWWPGERATSLAFGGPGRFYGLSFKPVGALPSGEWRHRLDIRRWRPDGERLPPLMVETTGRTKHWTADLTGVGTDGSLVVQVIDEMPEPSGISLASKAIVLLLLITPDGKILVQQNAEDLYGALLPPDAKPKVGATGFFVGGVNDLYFNPYSEKDYPIARFILKP
ncbi:MAG: hypothetical protein HY321_14260 [Armatimonadetes bacterium]|nr:hypothetical protein [Armatimonadota bacterium]